MWRTFKRGARAGAGGQVRPGAAENLEAGMRKVMVKMEKGR